MTTNKVADPVFVAAMGIAQLSKTMIDAADDGCLYPRDCEGEAGRQEL